MRMQDLQIYRDGLPVDRALQALQMGKEMKGRCKVPGKGKFPDQLSGERLGDFVRPMMMQLHGVEASVRPVTKSTVGASKVGKLQTAVGKMDDVVLTTQQRKYQSSIAQQRRSNETIEDAALRQLAIGMFDNQPVPRACSAYAYYQATGSDFAVIPVLEECLQSEDVDAFEVAAHCAFNVKKSLVKPFEGTIQDDQPNSPALALVPSRTVIIHGTWAKKQDWYKPGGDFHTYILNNVYPDVYGDPDFFFWSGGYSHARRRDAANKLVSWVNHHPCGTLRLMAHSHGANVVNIATKMGLQACTLIHLSPPVRPEYLPDISNVSSGQFFTVRPTIDLVVSILDGSDQDYSNTTVAMHETRIRCAFSGHSKCHDPGRWIAKDIPSKVTTVCP